MCALIAPVRTRTRIVIIRHVLEQAKHSNTGRLAALMLSNHALLTHGIRGHFDRAELDEPGTYLLFPDGPPTSPPPDPRPERIVVLDGSWSQARRMRQRIDALRGLPTLSLPAGPDRPRLRRPPRPGAMATIESIAAALELLGEPVASRSLLAAFDQMVERSARR